MTRPLKVTLSGIDGSGKSTSASAVSRRLAAMGFVVVHPLRRSYVDRPACEREYFADGIHAVVDRAHRAFDRRRSRVGVGLTNVAYARVWRAVEAWSIARFDPDVVISGRSAVLDPAVYAPFYFRGSRALTPLARVSLSRAIGAPAPADLRFLIEVCPTTAYARILERIARERAAGVEDREKWTHMHETPVELAELQREFDRCLPELASPVVRLDGERPQEEVVDEITVAIRAALAS